VCSQSLNAILPSQALCENYNFVIETTTNNHTETHNVLVRVVLFG